MAAVLFGPQAVTDAEWELAIKLGLVDPAGTTAGIVSDLHTFGMLMAHMDHAPASWDVTKFRAHVKKHPVPRTRMEELSAEHIARNGAAHVVGLGNKIGAEIGNHFIEADRDLDRKLRGTIRDVLGASFGDDDAADRMRERAVERGLPEDFFDDSFRSTIGRMKSDMGHATGDWARDWQRIAQTESHTAINEGLKDRWYEQELEMAEDDDVAPRRVRVFRVPRPDACKHCIRLYTDDGAPRLFYLDELEGNGTNIGKKVADWNPVIGATHPWCGCTLHRLAMVANLPKGWKSGQAAPTVVGPGGSLILGE
tara:strand:+ start:587 stop:1516 length:930 start_codon:yes stop_codon:yes gene_type:complete